MAKLKTISRILIGLFFIAAGINHFLNPVFYLQSMPPYLPWHEPLIYISGFFEVLLGLLVLVPRFAPLAAWGLIALLIAVFPANVHMAFNSHLYSGISAAALWLRLPIQFLFILWAYWHTKPDREKVRE